MHLMIDIETLDTKPSAVIMQIGAVAFDKVGVLMQTVINAHKRMGLEIT